MNTQDFYDEMDRLVEKGETTFPQYNLDLEAFHHLKAIKNRTSRLKGLLLFVGILAVILVAGIVMLFINPSLLQMTANKSDSGSADFEEIVQTLRSENRELRLTVTDLQSRLDEYLDREVQDGKKELVDIPIEDTPHEGETEPKVVTHVVVQGETLYSIARHYYGSGSMFKRIMVDNNITDASGLYVGMRLKIHPE